jgi:hypothetical protein
MPNDPYRVHTAPLTSKVVFYIFIQQIQVLNILNMVYTVWIKKNQLDVTFCILYFSSNSCLTRYRQTCAHELTTA